MTDSESRHASGPQIFLSYSHEDRQVAEQIADALSMRGTKVWFDEYEVTVGTSLATAIDRELAASDYVVVLLSRHSVQSRWVRQELEATYGREIDARAITVVPVLLEDCEVPPVLASKQYVDLRSNVDDGIAALAGRLSAAARMDFAGLGEREFEELIADLLKALGFEAQVVHGVHEKGFDIVATHRGMDLFGAEHRQRFLVACKHYRHGRASLDSVQTLIEALGQDPEASTGLLVTTAQFTSPVREWVAVQVGRGTRLRLMDGTDLRRLLLQHPEVARKHFAKTL